MDRAAHGTGCVTPRRQRAPAHGEVCGSCPFLCPPAGRQHNPRNSPHSGRRGLKSRSLRLSCHREVARPPLPPRGCPGARPPRAGSTLQRGQPGAYGGEGGLASPEIPFTGPGGLQVRPKAQRGYGVSLGPQKPAKGGRSLRTICPLTTWGGGSAGARPALPWASAALPRKGLKP